MAILIAYCIGVKKDHQTLLNFAILAGKWQKNAPFYIKSPVKNFHGRVKVGEASHRAPLEYATERKVVDVWGLESSLIGRNGLVMIFLRQGSSPWRRLLGLRNLLVDAVGALRTSEDCSSEDCPV